MNEVKNDSFDKAEWAAMKKADREKAYQMADEMTDIVKTNPERMKEFLNVMARFGHFSINNLLLIAAQKPDAKLLYDFNTWKDNDEYILKGETGILTLERGKEYTREDGSKGFGYNAKRLFDVSQTSAKDKYMEQTVSYDDRMILKALVNNAPCAVEVINGEAAENGPAAIYDPDTGTVYIAKNTDMSFLFSELSRELAIAYLDHGDFSRDDSAFQAECISYVVSVRNGMPVGEIHVPDVLGTIENKDVKALFTEVRNVAGEIEKNMSKVLLRDSEEKQHDKRSAGGER